MADLLCSTHAISPSQIEIHHSLLCVNLYRYMLLVASPLNGTPPKEILFAPSVHLDAAILEWRMPNEYQFGKALLQHKPEQGDGRIREMTKEEVCRISGAAKPADRWGDTCN